MRMFNSIRILVKRRATWAGTFVPQTVSRMCLAHWQVANIFVVKELKMHQYPTNSKVALMTWEHSTSSVLSTFPSTSQERFYYAEEFHTDNRKQWRSTSVHV
jgi:hypothetical protein